MNDTIALFLLWRFGLLTFGVLYSLYIYHHPAPTGWTWVTVTIGISATFIPTMLVQYFALLGLGPQLTVDDLQGVIIWRQMESWVLTGGPMIAGQGWKLIRQKRYINERKNGNAIHS